MADAQAIRERCSDTSCTTNAIDEKATGQIEVRLVHSAHSASLARDLATGLGGNPNVAAVSIQDAFGPEAGGRTVYGIAARLAARGGRAAVARRQVVIGIGEPAGAIAKALAAELIGVDCPVDAVLLLDLDLEARPDPVEALAWCEPIIVWSRTEDARRVRRGRAEVPAEAIAWCSDRLAEIVAEPTFAPMPPLLLTLRSGAADGEQIYCIPGAGASVVSFLELAQQARGPISIHGLQPRGLDGSETPYATVSAMAEALEALILPEHGQRPVHLVGHSFGGCVAFELALRLKALGRPPASLTMIDTRAPRQEPWPDDLDDLDVTRGWIRLNEQAAGQPLQIGAAELRDDDLFHNLGVVHRGMVRVGLLPERSSAEMLLGPMRMFAACVRTWYHTTSVYREPVRLIYLDDPKLDPAGNARVLDGLAAGWCELAPQLHIQRSPGNHITGLKMPHAARLASLMHWTAER